MSEPRSPIERMIDIPTALERLREIGERVKAWRDQMPADDPQQRAAFLIATKIGEMEATLAASLPTPPDPQ